MKDALIKIIFIFLSLAFVADSNGAIYTSISGKVIAEDNGQGIAGIGVLAVMLESNEHYYATTDVSGKYVLKNLKPGTYKIGFSKRSSYVSVKPVLKVVLPKGKNVVNANYVLKLGGSVSGIVYGADGVTPLNHVKVSAEVPTSQPEWVMNFDFTFTDNNGRYLLQGLPVSDNCVVDVEILGHAPLTKTARITKGETTKNVNFVVKWDDITGVSGYVKSLIDDKPVEGVGITLSDQSGNPIATAITYGTGRYSIVGVSPGIYKVTALWPSLRAKIPGNVIEKTNILIEQGKSTVVNFEFNKPVPIYE